MFSRAVAENSALLDQMSGKLSDIAGISWAAIQEKEGKPELRVWSNRPCWGEMRQYGQRGSFPKGTRPQDYHPGDLPMPIPPGRRLAIGAHINFRQGPARLEKAAIFKRLAEFLFSASSPYRKGFCLDGLELLSDKQGVVNAVLANSTDFDPTVWVALLMFLRSNSASTLLDSYEFYLSRGLDDLEALTAAIYFQKADTATLRFTPNFMMTYFLAAKLDLRRWAQGDARDLSRGRTMFEEEDYNRPEIQDLFLDANATPMSTRIATAIGLTSQPNHGWYNPVILEETQVNKVCSFIHDEISSVIDGPETSPSIDI